MPFVIGFIEESKKHRLRRACGAADPLCAEIRALSCDGAAQGGLPLFFREFCVERNLLAFERGLFLQLSLLKGLLALELVEGEAVFLFLLSVRNACERLHAAEDRGSGGDNAADGSKQ